MIKIFISVREPLLWSTRVQIALDSARGLEYIHEHTVPAYIHRDIKSSNILIDKNFHGKVLPVPSPEHYTSITQVKYHNAVCICLSCRLRILV